MKPSSTAMIAWPAVMFAKSRTMSEKGLVKSPTNSMIQTSGIRKIGRPCGTRCAQ